MIFLYNILLTLILLAFWPILVIWALIGGHGLANRLGILPKYDVRPVWIHSASVGEAGVAAVMRDILHEIAPKTPIIITSTTKMGKRRLEKILSPPDIAAILPLDYFIFIEIAMSRVNPRALIVVETELWPNLITIAKKRGIPVIIANGRISEKTRKWSSKLGSGFHKVTESIDIFLMKSQYDAENLNLSGVASYKISTIGNLKFSAFPDKIESININENPTIVFGSIRPKEYPAVIAVCKNVIQNHPRMTIVLAPRHLNTLKQLELLLESEKVDYQLRSQLNNPKTNILVLDTMGELLGFYASAQIAFVGGTLEDYGGHNPLEPAYFSVPVLFGPYIDANREAYDALISGGGGVMVEDAEKLKSKIDELLNNPQTRDKIGELARDVVKSMADVRSKYKTAIKESLAK
ncbi:MAG: 3-deoxy-D-manno-octulosonic acid transferase [bacterium]